MQIYPQRWRTSAGLLRINDFELGGRLLTAPPMISVAAVFELLLLNLSDSTTSLIQGPLESADPLDSLIL